MTIEVSKGTRRGRRSGVRDPDGIGVDRLQGAQSTGDAKFFDGVNASFQEQLLDVLERIQQQLGQLNNKNNLEPGERFIE